MAQFPLFENVPLQLDALFLTCRMHVFLNLASLSIRNILTDPSARKKIELNSGPEMHPKPSQ